MIKRTKRRRILRMRLPNAILFFAVVLCVWIISYLKPISWTTYTEMLFFDSIGLSNGAVVLQWESLVAKVANPPVSEANVYSLMPADPPLIDMGIFRLDRNASLLTPAGRPMVTNYEELTYNTLRIPMPPLVLLSAAWLTVSIARIIRRRREHKVRLKRGLCLKCSYDLRGNETGVCPECGKASQVSTTEAT